MNNNIFKATLLATAMGSCALGAVSQGYTTAALELLKERRVWFNSSNAAGAVFDNTDNYTHLKIQYDIEQGDYRRPQQGRDVKDLNVYCEGFMDLGSAYVWGEFSFDHQNAGDVGYNASVTDPYRGMPYYYIDTYHSDWRNQFYNMKFRASTPLYWNRIAFGIEGLYRASLAAKQRDIRVDTRFFELELVPGVVYEFLPGHRLGADFRFAAIKEDSRMSRAYSYTDHDYYMLYGLGVARKYMGGGTNINYHGNRYGGALQYNFATKGFNLLLEGRYSRKVENMDISYSDPRKEASTDEDLLDIALDMQFTGLRFSNFVRVGYVDRGIKGIQYLTQHDNTDSFQGWMDIFHSVRSTYDTRSAALEYSLLRNRDEEYVWRVDLGGTYTSLSDRYLLPECRKNSENLYVHLDARYNFKIGESLRRRLLVGIGGGYNGNLSGNYSYTASNPDYLTVNDIERVDENYLTSDWYNIRASVEYSQQWSRTRKMNVFGRVVFNCVKTSSYDFDHRSNLTFAIGVNF